MVDDPAPSGHLTAEDIERYWESRLRASRKLAESPECILVVEPEAGLIRLRTPATESPADVSGFDHIEFDIVQDYGESTQWFELSIEAENNRYEVYLVLASVVDMLAGGVPFKVAVDESLGAFKDILARHQKLTEEQQVGLIGELLLLEHCIDTLGVEVSLDAWLGAAGEEHDFVFKDFDAELKSTRSEARVHMINSATQLEPSPGRPLFLVSIQLTAAGAAGDGATLSDVVNRVRRPLAMQHRRVFDAEVGKAGWRDEDENLYPRRWVYRSTPRAYLVDDDFPALTPRRIADSVPQPELVVSIQYRLDVSQLDPSEVPTPVGRFCQEG